MRIGHGYDIHRLTVGRPLRLGGVTVPFERGLLGHSDGDVVLHAICDALLGAIAAGDIGLLFPDTEARFQGIDSSRLVLEVAQRVAVLGYMVGNLDVTVVAERPRLAPHIEAMRERIAELLTVGVHRINLKAKTNEGVDAVGSGDAIAATAVVLLNRKT